MLSELCECVQSIVPFNVDVDDALGVYNASAGFGVYTALITHRHMSDY